jgi:hypothetical protein
MKRTVKQRLQVLIQEHVQEQQEVHSNMTMHDTTPIMLSPSIHVNKSAAILPASSSNRAITLDTKKSIGPDMPSSDPLVTTTMTTLFESFNDGAIQHHSIRN